MKKGIAGLLLLILIPLIILVILFVSSKFIIPNPETVHESKQIEKNAQDTINQYQQKSLQDQKIDVK